MGGVIARAPRIDERRAGAEGAAGKPMPGRAAPPASRGFAQREHHGALTRGAGPMTNGSLRGAVAGRSGAEPVR